MDERMYLFSIKNAHLSNASSSIDAFYTTVTFWFAFPPPHQDNDNNFAAGRPGNMQNENSAKNSIDKVSWFPRDPKATI